MSETGVDQLSKVKLNLTAVQDHTAFLQDSSAQVAVHEASECFIIYLLIQSEMPTQLVSFLSVYVFLTSQAKTFNDCVDFSGSKENHQKLHKIR